MERPEAWTPIERYNIEQHGPGPMRRVGVFQAAGAHCRSSIHRRMGPEKRNDMAWVLRGPSHEHGAAISVRLRHEGPTTGH